MIIKTIKTEKIVNNKIKLEKFLDKYIKDLKENSVIAFSSKVISIMEGRVVSKNENKDKLIAQEADYISSKENKYGRRTTIKYHALVSGAGIDESNGNGDYILLPSSPQKTAKKIYNYLDKRFKMQKFGVIICDSRSMPLRCGASGVAIGFWGFPPLKSYIGKEDLFGRKLQFERANIVDALATAAVLAMGEGNEQTPIALIKNFKNIDFNKKKPTNKELKDFYLSLDDDIFHQFYDCFK